MTLTVPAYAKINLFLDIESLRADGYHNIISLMQSVSLQDTVTVEYFKGEGKTIEITCSDPNVPCNEKNLAYRAADVYPIDGFIKIHIEKRIPMSAGLAGGSTDAAAVLIALNSIHDAPLDNEALKTLGNKLGADIPFCIERGACIASGTGDRLENVKTMPYYPIVIAKKGDGMSTPEAYKALDRKYDSFKSYSVKKECLDRLLASDNDTHISDYSKGLFNIFEYVVEPCRPCVAELKEIMISNNATASMMSGSGTCVFGIFEREEDAKTALEALKNAGADAHLCYPIKK